MTPQERLEFFKQAPTDRPAIVQINNGSRSQPDWQNEDEDDPFHFNLSKEEYRWKPAKPVVELAPPEGIYVVRHVTWQQGQFAAPTVFHKDGFYYSYYSNALSVLGEELAQWQWSRTGMPLTWQTFHKQQG